MRQSCCDRRDFAMMSPQSDGSAAPATTATLLFTDIEGSTQRWERHPLAMAEALREHDVLLRREIEACRGRVFKTVGDAFYAIFTFPHDAVAAALAAQLSLATRDWSNVDGLRVRMAIHVGPVEARDGDFFGPTLNRIARLVSIGHGSQILLSASAAALLERHRFEGLTLLDLGEHRLKDLAHPERVFQATSADLQALFPPLRSLSVLPNNLPAQLTTFVGRRDVLAEARVLLGTTRVLTLVGAGGIGKTRVSLELANDALKKYPQGVYFVEFAAIAEPRDVVGTVLAALELATSSVETPERTLVEYLRSRRVLLLFDNCEHLIDEIARVGSEIVRACSDVTLIATSREALRIAGERAYRLPSLGVPAEGDDVPLATIEASEAVALFVARAKAADRTFALTEANAAVVADICRRLDGIALAIELVAARVAALSPLDLRARISGRLLILHGGNRTALPRQRTVRALIDWSYDLLDNDERGLLAQLALFADSFTLDAVVGVASNGDDFEVLDLLTRLVDKSLVAVDVDDRGVIARYRMLETIREYASEKLRSSDDATAAMARYVAYYDDLIERSFALWGVTPSTAWSALVENEIANIRSLLTWLFGDGHDPQRASALVARARRLYGRIAPSEGLRWIDVANAAVDDATALDVRAELALAHAQMLTALHRPSDALATAERAAALFEETQDGLGLAEARGFVGLALTMLGSSERGEALLAESIATYERTGARALRAYALSDLALSHYFSNDVSGSIALFNRARTAFVELGNEAAAIVTTSNLSEVRFDEGDANDALALIDSAIAGAPDARHLGMFYGNKAMYLTALERYDEAREAVRMGLRHARGAQAETEVAIALKHAAAITMLGRRNAIEADVRRAARVFVVAERRMRELGAVPSPSDQREADRTKAAMVEALGSEVLVAIDTETATWLLERAVAEAGSL